MHCRWYSQKAAQWLQRQVLIFYIIICHFDDDDISKQEKFFGIFESTLSVSVTTGYDWSFVSSETTSEEHSVQIQASAPSGYVLRIEQAVGHCDGNSAKTELFRISHLDRFGQVVKQTKQRMFSNGTTVLVDDDLMDIQPRFGTMAKETMEPSVPISVISD